MSKLVIYQTLDSIWRGNKPRREKLDEHTKSAVFRVLFMEVGKEMFDNLEEVRLVKGDEQLALMLYDILDKNVHTMYLQ